MTNPALRETIVQPGHFSMTIPGQIQTAINILLAERLNTVNFEVPEYQPLLDLMQQQHQSVAVRLDPQAPWGPRNRAPLRGIIVTGDHHCGCSDLVQQCV
ncbi:MAG TPA: hypothetical protein VGB81_08980, partial [Devosia sp.]